MLFGNPGEFSEKSRPVSLATSPDAQGMTLSPNIGPQELDQYREYLNER
jgi:hypothetical protein